MQSTYAPGRLVRGPAALTHTITKEFPMANFTTADIKALRERTGAGMMDAKKALTETNGDIEAAVDALRAKGLATAQKKSSRTAAEGLVGLAVEGTKGVAVEVNSETDFVAKNDQFQDFVRKVTETALATGANDVEALKAATYPGGGTVADKLTDMIATIGENQQIRRLKAVEVSNGVVVPYMHNAAAPNLGKIGVLVALESEADAGVLDALGKQIAMHIAAAFPLALSADQLDAELIERERGIAREKAAESGKPAEVQAKMVEGAVAKFAKENALLSQLFVMDNKTPISEVVAKAGKDAGAGIVLKDYVRFQLGEGIEKEVSDFAAEVAAAVKG
jgi:elongation factor Ts